MSDTRPTPETDAVFAMQNGQLCGGANLDFARKLERERDELANWKAEQMLVESQWDAQAVGRELGMTAGTDIRKNILPAIQQLKRERDAMLEAIREAAADLQNSRFVTPTLSAALAKIKPFLP
jgi:F0F1-type ATP synthase membrane subunit b/b'